MTKTTIHAYASHQPGGSLSAFEFEWESLGQNQVEIRVMYCGICYSDISMIDNEWGFSRYPLVPGHEVIGEVLEVGDKVSGLKPGQIVGVGWYASSCETCALCKEGAPQLCARAQGTIIGRHGGFADRIRCDENWAIVLPKKLVHESAGPLFCGGITVFDPILIADVKAGDRVAVVGLGGLGHLAVQFLKHWGCQVTVLSSTAEKHDDALRLGASEVFNIHDAAQLRNLANRFDFVLVTAYAELNWSLVLQTLRARGRLHIVGAVPKPIPVEAFALIGAQRCISGSALGSPKSVDTMLKFCQKHKITAETELFPMSEVNAALDHLRGGKARYRVVLKSDF
jgi:uncharacterized zinc-type alcohol dehydrogenase-like protein